MIHPLVLGEGRRLFADGVPFTSLKLVSTKTTDKGVIIATYQPTNSKWSINATQGIMGGRVA